jgi:hypothetical protein
MAMLSGWDCAWTTSFMQCAFLEWLREVALLAPCDDVVVEGWLIAFGDDRDAEGGVLYGSSWRGGWCLSC